MQCKSLQEMYASNGSYEISLWIAELRLREREEREAMAKAQNQPPPVMGGR